jgi:hypothetical protein
MREVVVFVLGVLLIAGFVSGLGWKESHRVYDGEMMNRLFTTVDRVFRRRQLP